MQLKGNQQFVGLGVARYCPICKAHRGMGGGHLEIVGGLKQWVCRQHPKESK